jgi:hypothetical protein
VNDPTTSPAAPRGAVRWWFEDRGTGRITIAQFPNWPLFAIAALWVVRRIVDAGSTLADVAAVVTVGLWLFWAGDELVRGVNPWRRLLGAGVIVWQLARLVG